MQQLQFPTDSFIVETIMILFLIAALGSLVGVWFAGVRWKSRILEAVTEGSTVEIDGMWFYIITAPRMHDFIIAEERCKRNDRKRATIHEMTGG